MLNNDDKLEAFSTVGVWCSFIENDHTWHCYCGRYFDELFGYVNMLHVHGRCFIDLCYAPNTVIVSIPLSSSH